MGEEDRKEREKELASPASFYFESNSSSTGQQAQADHFEIHHVTKAEFDCNAGHTLYTKYPRTSCKTGRTGGCVCCRK